MYAILVRFTDGKRVGWIQEQPVLDVRPELKMKEMVVYHVNQMWQLTFDTRYKPEDVAVISEIPQNDYPIHIHI